MSRALRLELHITAGVDGEPDEPADLDDIGNLDGVTVRRAPAEAAALTESAWRDDDFEFWAFDRHLDELVARGEPLHVAVAPRSAAAIAREILTRGQRLAPRRNAATEGAWFDRVLDEHRGRHDLARPLVRADHDHALDAWQWSLRLDPEAPAAVQLAALLHDIERLTSEADARIEHLAPDYQAFKDAHARAGAHVAEALLRRAGVDAALAAEVAALVAVHERAGNAALAAINDADALSFFSLNCPGYLAYFGPAQTAAKVAYTLARMSERARRELPALRIPRLVRAEIHDHLA
jgi:hypothetical protein